MAFHKDEIGGSLHNVQAFTYADATSRLNAVGLLPADIGKIAKQTDTSRFYILLSDSPVTWSEVTATSTGGGGINYISNTNSEDSVADWHTYADTAGALPVDGANAMGTGTLSSGSPVITAVPSTAGVVNGQTITGVSIPSNTTVVSFVVNTSITLSNSATANGAVSWSTFGLTALTITRSTSSPLRGNASFLITKDAVNRQGQGASIDFTIDRADLAAPLSISFDYEPGSGFVSGDSSDLRIYIYDVTNGIVIQPTPFTIQGYLAHQWTLNATFQTSSNSTQYRLIIHVATTSAIAWTFKCDNFRIGPQSVATGAPVSDWVEFPMTIAGSVSAPTKGSNVYDKAYWRRLGDSMEIVYTYRGNGAGAAGSGDYLFQVPTGYVIDTNKIRVDSAQNAGVVGSAMVGTAAANFVGSVKVYSTASLALEILNDVTGKGNVGSINAPMSNAAPLYSFQATVPIVGWASSVAMSNDTDNRVLMVHAGSTSSQNLTGSPVIVNFDSVTVDTHGAVTTGAGWNFRAPIGGRYRVSASFLTNSVAAASNNQYYTLTLRKNGVQVLPIATVYSASASAYRKTASGSTIVTMNAGDTLDFRIESGDVNTHALAGGANDTFIDIERLAGPATVATTETVAAAYSTAAGQSFTSGATAVVNYGTRDYDTHSAVTIGANWFFTCPIAGKYTINAYIGFASNATGIREIYIRKNGVNQATNVTGSPGSDVGMVGVNYTLNCLAGDQISLTGLQTSGGNLTLQISSGGLYNFVSIVRTGN